MLDLTKTTDLVKKELDNDLFLLEVLKDELVNVSALARTLLPTILKNNPKATVESVTMAIKRYVDAIQSKKVSTDVSYIIAHAQLSTKNDVIHKTFKRNNAISAHVSKISSKIRWEEDEIFLVNQGSGEITVIIDKRNQDLLDPCKADEIESTDNITIISFKEPTENGRTISANVPGVYAHLITQIARRSISIVSVISTYSQITLAFRNSDFLKAYETLNSCINFHRKILMSPATSQQSNSTRSNSQQH